LSAFVFRAAPDAAPGRVEDELRIDGAPGSAMPNVGHSQTNSNGPAGGSGHVHHLEKHEHPA
jgi:hypothetical protein